MRPSRSRELNRSSSSEISFPVAADSSGRQNGVSFTNLGSGTISGSVARRFHMPNTLQRKAAWELLMSTLPTGSPSQDMHCSRISFFKEVTFVWTRP